MKQGSLFFEVKPQSAHPLLQMKRWMSTNKAMIAAVLFLLCVEGYVGATLLTPGQAGGMAIGLFLYSLVWLCYVISVGKELSKTPDGDVGKVGRIDDHVFYVRMMTFTLLMGAVAIEVAVRKSGGLWGPLWLMLIHFTMVGSAVLTLVSTLVFNGLEDPERHRVWVPRFAWSYLGTIGTGTVLLVLKFPIT